MTTIQPSNCPVCLKQFDAATSPFGDSAPTPGDLTVCIYCASFLIFEQDLRLRLMTEQEIGELPDEARIQIMRVRRAIKAVSETATDGANGRRKDKLEKNDTRRGINPAALMAAFAGDLDNAAVAMTPGGIEAQEVAGQAMFVASATLPKEMLHGCTREKLKAMGIKFGQDADDLFVTVQLPAGWKKQATDHSMWSDLLDDKGRKRASMFYKAAFYDREATISLVRRYSYNTYEDGSDDEHYRVVIKDGNTVIHVLGEYPRDDYEAREKWRSKAEAWLAERFPQWQDDMAYWD